LRVNPPLHNVCVGPGTLSCFYQYFPQASASAPLDGIDSEAVLRMPLWQDSALRQVTILNGEGGRDWLTNRLLGMGKSVQTISLYQRVEKRIDWNRFRQLSQDHHLAVCVYSSEAVELLFQQVPADLRAKLQSLLYFTIHQRIADELIAQGAGRILVGKQGHGSVQKLLREHLIST
jgi:uroporphyrinogen-III synthase